MCGKCTNVYFPLVDFHTPPGRVSLSTAGLLHPDPSVASGVFYTSPLALIQTRLGLSRELRGGGVVPVGLVVSLRGIHYFLFICYSNIIYIF